MIPLPFLTSRPTRNFPHVGLRRAAVIACILLGTWLSAPAQNTPVSISSKPADIPNSWRGLIGEYGPDNDVHYVLEKGGRLTILRKNGGEWSLRQGPAADAFELDLADSRVLPVRFERIGASRATRFTLTLTFFRPGSCCSRLREAGRTTSDRAPVSPGRRTNGPLRRSRSWPRR